MSFLSPCYNSPADGSNHEPTSATSVDAEKPEDLEQRLCKHGFLSHLLNKTTWFRGVASAITGPAVRHQAYLNKLELKRNHFFKRQPPPRPPWLLTTETSSIVPEPSSQSSSDIQSTAGTNSGQPTALTGVADAFPTTNLESASTLTSVPTQISSLNDSSSTIDPSASTPSKGLSTSTKLGLGIGLGLGIPLILALTAALILFFRRRRRHQPLSQQEAFLHIQNSNPKAHSELSTVETPRTPPTPVIPPPSDGAGYEAIPAPHITPRNDFNDFKRLHHDPDSNQTTDPSPPTRQQTISRKPLNGGALELNQPSGSGHQDQDPESTARIPEAGPERENVRASLTRLHIPDSWGLSSVESHGDEVSPVSPVSAVSAFSNGGGGSIRLGKTRDVSPGR